MRAQWCFLGVTISAVATLAAACAGSVVPGGPSAVTAGSYDQLVAALRAKSVAVEDVGAVTQPFFEPEGRVVRLEGQDVQVFEFATEEDASSASETIAPDGGSVGTSMVTWISAPHFYHSGKLIVLYVGEGESVLAALQDVLGPQIAGR